MKSKSKWILTAIIIVAVIAFGAYRMAGPKKGVGEPVISTGGGKGSVLNVNGLIIKQGPLTDEASTFGILIPDEEVDLSFETAGKIVEINFTEGTQVKKGQLLAKINDKPLQAQLAKFSAQLKLAEDRVFRQNALLAKDAVSQEAYEQASTDLATLKAEMDLVRANIALTELRAPFDGTIGLRNVSEGAYASTTIIIAKLTKTSPLKVEFSVPEHQAAEIKKGMNLTFTVDGSLAEFSAKVYAVESRIEDATRMLLVRALYENKNNNLTPGRVVNLKFKISELSDAIVIPSQAIIPEMGVDKVFLYKNGVSQPVEIEKGLRTDTYVQVMSGLNVGDTIITSGTLQLRTGLPVSLDKVE